MPVLIGLGLPKFLPGLDKERSDEAKLALVAQLREAVASVEELEIKPTCVSVFIPQDQIAEGLGEELIVQVTGLYERPNRTDEVLKRLSEAIVAELSGFARRYLPQCRYVEAYPTTCQEQTTAFLDPNDS